MLPAMENWNRHTGTKEVIFRDGLWRELIGALLVPGRDSVVDRRYFQFFTGHYLNQVTKSQHRLSN